MSFAADDLGAGNMKVARPDKQGNPVGVPDENGAQGVRSALFIDEDNSILTGDEAVTAGYQNPERCILDWKPHLGTPAVLATGPDGKEYRARDVAAILIGKSQRMFEAATGEVMQDLVLGCPANFDVGAKEDLQKAAEDAGVNVLRIAHEPTLAALGNNVHERGDGSSLVFDLGHFTHDVSLVQVTGNHVTVTHTDGVPELGGRDFNACIAQHMRERFVAEHGAWPEDDPLAEQALAQNVEQVKHTLSKRKKSPVVVSCQGNVTTFDYTRDEFEKATVNLVDQAVACAERVLAAAGVDPKDLRTLLVVGGASAMPMIHEALKQRLGVTPASHCEARFATALGGVTQAQLELQEQGRTATFQNTALPAPTLFTQDVIGTPVGVTTVSQDGRSLFNAVILDRNAPMPSEQRKRFQLAEDNATAARIELLIGEDGQPRDEARLILGHFELTDLPPVAGRPHEIDIHLSISKSGLITATATCRESGKSADLTLELTRPADEAA